MIRCNFTQLNAKENSKWNKICHVFCQRSIFMQIKLVLQWKLITRPRFETKAKVNLQMVNWFLPTYNAIQLGEIRTRQSIIRVMVHQRNRWKDTAPLHSELRDLGLLILIQVTPKEFPRSFLAELYLRFGWISVIEIKEVILLVKNEVEIFELISFTNMETSLSETTAGKCTFNPSQTNVFLNKAPTSYSARARAFSVSDSGARRSRKHKILVTAWLCACVKFRKYFLHMH